jgi:HlyD family secretion protein
MPEGKPVPVDITTGISDGSYTEVTSGALNEGQEIIIEATTGNNKSAGASRPFIGVISFLGIQLHFSYIRSA